MINDECIQSPAKKSIKKKLFHHPPDLQLIPFHDTHYLKQDSKRYISNTTVVSTKMHCFEF